MTKNSLLIVYTGNGKGKTTAALGQALRAAGHGLKVCIIQFIKNLKDTGEVKALAALADLVEIHTTGSGFTWQAKDQDELKQVAEQGWSLAREKIMSGSYDMIILDEFTYPLAYKLIDEAQALEFISKIPPGRHLIITGRGASPALIASADLVTEMQEIKHPYKSGVKAQKGIEF